MDCSGLHCSNIMHTIAALISRPGQMTDILSAYSNGFHRDCIANFTTVEQPSSEYAHIKKQGIEHNRSVRRMTPKCAENTAVLCLPVLIAV